MKLWTQTYAGDLAQAAMAINSDDTRMASGLVGLHQQQAQQVINGGWSNSTVAVFLVDDAHYAELVEKHGLTLSGGADGIKFSLDTPE